jgi:UDP-N-acetylglucosamine 2-epimerase
MKIVSIVGARPQFIKLAPLSQELMKQNVDSVSKSQKILEHIIVHTGQHFDKEMSESLFTELGITAPKHNLNINGGMYGNQTGRMLIELEKIVTAEKPDLIIVFGDTNSTLAGALVASKLLIPIIHIEAGLRSFNKNMPEEINRIVADHTCDFLFAPTKSAVNNLDDENLSSRTFYTGDIMVDSLKLALKKTIGNNILNSLCIKKNSYYLLTLHRPYNVDNPINLIKIFNEITHLDMLILFPVHPRTRIIIEKNNLALPNNIKLIKPVGYLDFVQLQSNCNKIITDSGGIQKESYILRKPCITLRSETEWVETVDAGWNLLIDPLIETNYSQKIISFEPSLNYEKVFGENVSLKMVEIINRILC